jgi:hypothetical protein
MKIEGSLPCSQQTGTGHNVEITESIQHPHICICIVTTCGYEFLGMILF